MLRCSSPDTFTPDLTIAFITIERMRIIETIFAVLNKDCKETMTARSFAHLHSNFRDSSSEVGFPGNICSPNQATFKPSLEYLCAIKFTLT